MLFSIRMLVAGGAVFLSAASLVAQAGTPLTAEQSQKVTAYLAQSPVMPVRTPTNTQAAIASGVVLAVGTPAPADKPAPVLAEVRDYLMGSGQKAPAVAPTIATAHAAADAAPVHIAATAAGSETAPTATQQSKGMLAILTLGAPESAPAGITYGMAAGQGVAPAVPVTDAFVHDTALAVVAAFQNPDHKAADAVATYAATPALDPAVEERIALVQAVYKVDGTDELIRHFVGTTHMRLIIEEVARHIDFSKLSESDKYRLAAIAAVAQTELEDKIVRMNALIQAQNLTKADLLQLLAAYDNDAQRKLTYLRMHDDGKVDQAAELDIRLAQYQIIKAYESRH